MRFQKTSRVNVILKSKELTTAYLNILTLQDEVFQFSIENPISGILLLDNENRDSLWLNKQLQKILAVSGQAISRQTFLQKLQPVEHKNFGRMTEFQNNRHATKYDIQVLNNRKEIQFYKVHCFSRTFDTGKFIILFFIERDDQIAELQRTRFQKIISNKKLVVFFDRKLNIKEIGHTTDKNLSVLQKYLQTGSALSQSHLPANIQQELTSAAFKASRGRGSPEILLEFFEQETVYYFKALVLPVSKKEEEIIIIFRDQTLEEKRRQKNHIIATKYKQLFDHFPYGITTADKDGQIVESNKIAQHLLGIATRTTNHRKINSKIWKIIKRDGSDFAADEFPSVIALKTRKSVYSVEMGLVREDKSVQWISVSAMPVDLEHEKVIIVYHDINERVEQDAKILHLALVAEKTTDAVVITDSEGKIVWVNKAYEALTGYKLKQITGKTPGSFMHGPKTDQHTVERIRKSLKAEKSVSAVILNYSKSKREYWLDIHIDPVFDSANRLTHWIAVERDATERINRVLEEQHAKQRELETNRMALVGSWEYDLAEKKLFWSEVTKQIYGVSREYEPNLKAAINFYIQEDRIKIKSAVDRLLVSGEPYTFEARVKRKDGSIIWVRTQGKGEKKDNKVVRIFGSIQDITTMVQYRHQLEQAVKSKSEFVSNVSHEIRTPLNAVIGYTEMLGFSHLSDIQHQYVENVTASAKNLLRLLNDVLDFSKIEAGKLSLVEENCNLTQLLFDVADIVKFSVHQKNVELLVTINQSISHTVKTDAVVLRQILINLAGNAVKFTENGEIEISAHKVDETEKNIRYHFNVRDTGIGIPKNVQNKIFEAFTQQDSSTTRKYGGTGLGLTISNQLLKLFNTKLNLSSKPGKGSIFSFEITFQKTGKPKPIEKPVVPFQKVLVIDDNKANCRNLSFYFDNLGMQCNTATNQKEALQKINTDRFDLILIDYHMPNTDAVKLIQKIRMFFAAANREIPMIILLHANESEATIESLHQLKIDAHLVKPVRKAELLKLLANVKNGIKSNNRQFKKNKNLEQLLHSVDILLAEDNIVNRTLLKAMLVKLLPNANITETENGKEAVDKVKKNNFNIAFMDIHMPVLDGFSASRKIRTFKKSETLLVIATTASTDDEIKQKALDSGMTDFLIKPITLESLKIILNKYLRNL